MCLHVTLTARAGPLKGEEYVFDGPAVVTIGRSPDCLLQLPGGEVDLTASRHHCRITITPPAVRVLDLGSRNGTYVNGEKVRQGPEAPHEPPGVALGDGDEVRVGCTVFAVGIKEEPSGLEVGDPAEHCPRQEDGSESAGRECDSCC